jgi:hypothetical protein
MIKCICTTTSRYCGYIVRSPFVRLKTSHGSRFKAEQKSMWLFYAATLGLVMSVAPERRYAASDLKASLAELQAGGKFRGIAWNAAR